MKIQAIMFMRNELKGAQFTLENFRKHNPDIPVRIINGGVDCSEYVLHIDGVEIVNTTNLWHFNAASLAMGGFTPEYFDYLFEYGLNQNYTHTLYLEPDVLTNRAITIPPKYDISGPLNMCHQNDYALYDAFGINEYRVHTGCGGTIYTYNYFKTVKEKGYDIYQRLYDKYSKHYYQDIIATLVARLYGMTFGHWEEVSNIPAHIIGNQIVPVNMNATLVHKYKINE